MTMKIHKIVCSALLALLAATNSPAEEFVVGQHYQEVKPAVAPSTAADKVEVLELFWYGCPHCYAFEPQLQEWLKKKADYIEFVQVPAVFAHNWEIHARAFYAAQQLGVLDKLHEPLFDAIHKEGRKISSEEEVAQFFIDKGVSAEDFKKARRLNIHSPAVHFVFTPGCLACCLASSFWTMARSRSPSGLRFKR